MTIICGVDGCRDGCVVVWQNLTAGRMWLEVVPDILAVARSTPAPKAIV